MATWKQIRRFVGLLKELGLAERPEVVEALDSTIEAGHLALAREEIESWRPLPLNPGKFVEPIATWFAIGDGLMAIGVGAGDTGIAKALDYWRRVGNRGDVAPAAKAREFAKRAGLPEVRAAFSVPELVHVQTDVDPQQVEMASLLRAAGFSAIEVAKAMRFC